MHLYSSVLERALERWWDDKDNKPTMPACSGTTARQIVRLSAIEREKGEWKACGHAGVWCRQDSYDWSLSNEMRGANGFLRAKSPVWICLDGRHNNSYLLGMRSPSESHRSVGSQRRNLATA
jgi:hypothetical protein